MHILFNKTLEQCRQLGARGGRALGASATSLRKHGHLATQPATMTSRAFGVLVVAAAGGIAAAAKVGQLGVLLLVSLSLLAGGFVAMRGWPALGRVMLVYALAARVPVAALMLPAIIGHWGTHYDALPPNFPPMDPVKTWALIGLWPQMTLWIGFTLIGGILAGAIAAAAAGGRRQEAVASAA